MSGHGFAHGKAGLVKFGAVSTVIVAFPTRLSAVQEIVAVPGATAVATPVVALIVATDRLLLAQPPCAESHATGGLLPRLSLNCAVNGMVVLTGAPIVLGSTVIEVATKTNQLPDPVVIAWPVIGDWAQQNPESNAQSSNFLKLVTNVKCYLYESCAHRS